MAGKLRGNVLCGVGPVERRPASEASRRVSGHGVTKMTMDEANCSYREAALKPEHNATAAVNHPYIVHIFVLEESGRRAYMR